jgi:plasmid stabilization system protein ParE
MRVIFSPEARQEFDEAEQYYDRQVPRLGERFRAEVRSALPRIRAWPLSYPIERGEIRRLTFSRFPYKLLYSVEADHIYIIAVAQHHREPQGKGSARQYRHDLGIAASALWQRINSGLVPGEGIEPTLRCQNRILRDAPILS